MKNTNEAYTAKEIAQIDEAFKALGLRKVTQATLVTEDTGQAARLEKYYAAKLGQMRLDNADIVAESVVTIKFYPFSEGGFDHVHLDKDGNIPEDNLVYFNKQMLVASEDGIRLSLEVVNYHEEPTEVRFYHLDGVVTNPQDATEKVIRPIS